MSKEVFHKSEDYTFFYSIHNDEYGSQFHVHADVNNFTPTVLKDMYIKFVMLFDFARSVGYDKMYSISPNPKFCELFGAVSLGSWANSEVMVWES